LVRTKGRGVHLVGSAGLILLCGVLLLAACGSEGSTAPTEPAGVVSETPTGGAEDPSAETAGTLAAAGREVFGAECARCHGTLGEGLEGPAIIGENTNLPAFVTARGLYDFIRLGMPLDAPGSLPEENYLAVLAFLLLENGKVQAGTPLSPEALDEIDLH
jgi:mono/diheme cytochrome c family protein